MGRKRQISKKKASPPKKDKNEEASLENKKFNERALKSPPSYATVPNSSSLVKDFSKVANVESNMNKEESVVDSQFVQSKEDGSCHPEKAKKEPSTAKTTADKDDTDEQNFKNDEKEVLEEKGIQNFKDTS